MRVSVQDADGTVGFGEAAPLAGYDLVSIDDVRTALEDCRGPVSASDGESHGELLAECARVAVLPQAVAAIDLALWDLAGRRAGAPVWSCSAPGRRRRCESTRRSPRRTAPAPWPRPPTPVRPGFDAQAEGGHRRRRRAARGGAGGRRSADGDPARRQRRLVGVRGGRRRCARWRRPGSSCARSRSAASRRSPSSTHRPTVALAIDESVGAPRRARPPVCDAVCLKIARGGGITGVLDAARRARAAGYEVYLASTLDGPLGISAALHAAAAIKPDRAVRPGHARRVRRPRAAVLAGRRHDVAARRAGAGRRAQRLVRLRPVTGKIDGSDGVWTRRTPPVEIADARIDSSHVRRQPRPATRRIPPLIPPRP